MWHFKQELIDNLDYYSNQLIRTKQKGPAACDSQTTSPFIGLNNLQLNLLSTFSGTLLPYHPLLCFNFLCIELSTGSVR